MIKKVLIIGSKGMLGHDLMDVFQDLNPIGVDKPRSKNFSQIKPLSGKLERISLSKSLGRSPVVNEVLLRGKKELDITDKTATEKFILDLKPDLIINAAAYTDVDGCETLKDLAMSVNGYAVGHLAKASQKVGAVFVHYSTDYVFDGKNPKGYREDDKPRNPVNIYGESKLLGEKELLKVANNNPDFHYYLIRTSWLFGKNGKNFVDTILRFGKEKEELKVVDDQHGKPTYTVDLAKRTQELISGGYSRGIYHITNENVTTWYDFTLEIFEIYREFHPEIKLAKVIPCVSEEFLRQAQDKFPRPAKRPAYSILLNTKLPSSRPWPAALRDYFIRLRRIPRSLLRG